MASVSVHFKPLQGNASLGALKVKACDKADAACANPITQGTVDAMGDITLSVPTGTVGFDGYFDISGGIIVPTLLYYLPPVGMDIPAGSVTVPLVTTDTFGLLGVLLAAPNANEGHVIAIGQNCMDAATAGMVFTAAPAAADTLQAYVANSLPDKTAKSTDATGISLVINLPVGTEDVSFSYMGVTTATEKVFIRKGTITYATLPPTP
jgi:hypothetical protein